MRPSIRSSLTLLLVTFILIGWVLLKIRPGKEEVPAKPPVALSHESHAHSNPARLVIEEIDTAAIDDFNTWLADYRAGRRDAAFMGRGSALAEQRRSAMLGLIQHDARAALESAIGYADYQSLPDAIQEWVERPYSSTGDVEVIAICDHDYHTPEYRVNVYLKDATRLRTGTHSQLRTGLSKLDVPLQGIELEGWTAIQPTVFEVLEGADVDWARENLPTGNPDPTVDFLTGEALGPNPVTVVAGGFSFLFKDEDNLATLEAELKSYDNLPGKYTGSSVIFSEEVQELVLAKGFPMERIRESQNQLSIEDTTGDKTALFIRIVFPDKMDPPISDTDLESQIDGAVSGHLNDYSYNQTTMNATVTSKVYTASMDSAEYAYTGEGDEIDEKDLWDEAVAAYKDDNPGDPFTSFDIVGISFPKIDGVGWAGLGTVGGANSKHWLNGVPSTGTIVHEFGHNYGLNHSNYWVFNKTNAASVDPVDATGETEEYGDFWDVMGKGDEGLGHFHMAAKRFLRWLGSDQIETIDSEGTYAKKIYRFDHKDANPGLQGLEIKKGTDENYWIGFRRAYVSNANYYRGAYVLWERPPTNTDRNQGWIIDTTPDSDGERQDAGISLGRTYSDTAAGVHITPIAIGGTSPEEWLDVVVNYGSFAGNNAPEITTLSVPSSGDARTVIALSVDGSDQDGDDLAYSWNLGNGEVYSNSASVNVTFTVGGTYDVAVTVSDMKGGVTTQSAQIEIADPVNTWSTQGSGTVKDLFALANNGTHVVVAGDEVILRSSDGKTWTDQSPGGATALAINGICWTGSEFIGVGRDYDFGINGWKPVIYTSPDGETWTEDFAATGLAGGVFYAFKNVASNSDGSKVMAVGDKGLIYKRIDGGEWTAVDLGLSESNSLDIAFGGGVFVLGGYDFENSGLLLFRTSDGTNWEDLKDNSDLMGWWGLDNIAYFNGFFIGSGFYSRTVFSENGGVNWQTLEQGDTISEPNSFAFGNGVYYAIGIEHPDNSSMPETDINLVSSNGKIWKKVDAGVTEVGNAIIYYKNTFVIVGDGGSIKQSGLVEAGEEILAAPVISPLGQSFMDSIDVTLTTTADGAEIRYTLDGSEPDPGALLYEGVINLTATTTLKAKVFKGELAPSDTASATFTKILSGYAAWIDGFEVGEFIEASDNPDGDWARNLLERAVGSAPDDGDSVPSPPELSFDGEGKPVFTIHRLSKSEDVALSIEKSTNLVDWTPWATTVTMDTNTLLVLTSGAAVEENPCFLRIKAEE